MCGRFALDSAMHRLRAVFAAVNALPNFAPSWNIAPRQLAPVVRLHPQTGARHLDLLSWGLLPHWTSSLAAARRPINARAETAATTPIFRDAMARRRCLVPMDAFYEWQPTPGGKIPHAIARADAALLVAAGLWEGWRAPDGEVVRSFTILTTAANPALQALHDRMPVILEPADWPLWLGEAAGDPAGLLHPSTAALRLWRVGPSVGPSVGTVRHNGPDLLAPIAP